MVLFTSHGRTDTDTHRMKTRIYSVHLAEMIRRKRQWRIELIQLKGIRFIAYRRQKTASIVYLCQKFRHR